MSGNATALLSQQELDRVLRNGCFGMFAGSGKWALLGAIALVRGRVGRDLLKRMASFILVAPVRMSILDVVTCVIVFVQVVLLVHHVVRTSKRTAVGTTATVSALMEATRERGQIRPELRATATATRVHQERRRQATPPARKQISKEMVVVEFPGMQRALAVPRSFHCGANNSPHNPMEEKNHLVAIDDSPLDINFQLPIYVCDRIFWNDIHITTTTTSGPTSSSSTSSPRASFHIQVKMYMQKNEEHHRNQSRLLPRKWFCQECGACSHSVSKKAFQCMYSQPANRVTVYKSTFHPGERWIMGNYNDRMRKNILSFDFKTQLEQIRTVPKQSHRDSKSWSGWTFKQNVTFQLLPTTAVESDVIPQTRFRDNFDWRRKKSSGILAESPTMTYSLEVVHKIADEP